MDRPTGTTLARMTRVLKLPLILAVVGAVLIVVGVAVGEPDIEIEGAYFNQSVEEESGAAVLSEVGPGLLSPADGNLWLGAGIAFLVIAVGAAVTSRRLASN